MTRYLWLLTCLLACASPEKMPQTQKWKTYELTFYSPQTGADNPYLSVDFWANFTNEQGQTIKRPGFWDGDSTWRIRFASPDDHSLWSWQTFCNDTSRSALHRQQGQVQAVPYTGTNRLLQKGLLKPSPGKRNVVHANGRPFLMVGDTPWALPFRATKEQATHYAKFRQAQGFNTALLMTVQPDMKAEGPAARNTNEGFMRGFEDLAEGHINQLNPSYFQYLDSLIAILLDHEIVPVYQPIFHGFGWKGLEVLGNHIEPEEYVRYTQYLLARYGSQPAMWLLAGDNGGRDPGVKEAGEMLEIWDAYTQPTGLHYNGCDDFIADWAKDNPIKHCMHYNKTYQEADWLDFQWAQTGHAGEHQLHKVTQMYDNQPTKAVANGEPTYEGMKDGKNGLGWWQGEEAWTQLMSGGTMGVVYGAASLWQWKVTPNEPGWTPWAVQAKSWIQALEMEGAQYVGFLSKALEGVDMTDIQRRPDLLYKGDYLLAKPGQLYLSYLPTGGEIEINNFPPEGLRFQWFNPQSGTFYGPPTPATATPFYAPDNNPWVLIIQS